MRPAAGGQALKSTVVDTVVSLTFFFPWLGSMDGTGVFALLLTLVLR